MNSIDRFDLQVEICNKLGFKKAGEMYGITPHAMRARIKKVYPDFLPKVKIHKTRRISKEDDKDIIRQRKKGVSHKELAEKYNTTPQAMRVRYSKLMRQKAKKTKK